MAWQDYADLHVNTPVVLVELAFNSGTRYYGMDFVRTSTYQYKAKILSFPTLSSSVGDIKRTFERSNISIIFDDSDYEFRTLEDEETVGLKNISATIKVAFQDDSFATPLTVWTGQIYDWERLDELRFRIDFEQVSKNLDNRYPEEIVDLSDYADAHSSAINKLVPIVYGEISASGLSDEGAFPTLFVHTTLNSERHLACANLWEELVTNGGFASDASGWSAGNSATLASVAGGQSGNCLRITGDGTNNPYAYQSITVEPGSHYRFYCYMKAGTESEYWVGVYDLSNSAYIYFSGWLTESAGDWSTNVDTAFDAPSGCTSVRIDLYQRSQSGEGKTFLYDSVVMFECVDIPRVYIDGTLKTLTTHYTIGHNIVGSYVHNRIHWVSGVNPTSSNVVTCDVKFGERAPVQAIYHFLDKYCGHSSGDFNTTSYDAARDKEDERGYTLQGALASRDALRTILDRWRDEIELDIYWNTSGEICFNYMSAVAQASGTEYSDLLDILDSFESDPQVLEIMNYLEYFWNHDYARNYFYSQGYTEDTTSQTKYAETFRDTSEFRWIRSATMAADIAGRKLMRFKNPLVFDKYPLPLKSFSEALTDTIDVTHFEGAGSSGYSGRSMQIRSIDLDLNNFVNTVQVEDTSVYMGSFCRLGDRTTLGATWLVASAADKEYFYVCDQTTGEFSNGDPGKQLFD